MRIGPPCPECIIKDVREAAFLLSRNQAMAERLVGEAQGLIQGAQKGGGLPSQAITQVHRLLKERSGINIPFRERRERTNWLGMALAKRISERIQAMNPKEKFETLARWAVAANTLDFRTAGAGYDFDLETVEAQLRKVLAGGLAVNDSADLFEALQKAQRLLYVLDNVGEIAFDRMFIEACLKPGRVVAAVVRGGAITSDVIRSDAAQVGLDAVVDRIVSSGSDTLGLIFEEASTELMEEIRKADLVIAKGQANYYVFSDLAYRKEVPGKVACLFTTKCDLVAGQFGMKGKVSILKMM